MTLKCVRSTPINYINLRHLSINHKNMYNMLFSMLHGHLKSYDYMY